jgi:diphthamide biosynthesis methyltransferase
MRPESIVLSAVMFGSIRLFTTSHKALNAKWMEKGVGFGTFEAINVSIMAASAGIFGLMCALEMERRY